MAVKTFDNPRDIQVKFKSSCGSGPVQDTSTCSDIGLGKSVDFIADITLLRCLDNPATFHIKPVGIDQQLTINVKSLCKCPCENPGNPGFVANSPDCQNHGDLTCGICHCSDGFTGKKCECNESNLYANGNEDDPK